MTGLLRMSDAYSLGIHAMAYLAATPGDRPMAAGELAEFFSVSEAHLAKVLQRLARVGLLVSRRGAGGGFVLGRPAEEITFLDIYQAIDGPLNPSHCLLGRELCPPGECITRGLLESIHKQVHEYLSQTRLSDLRNTAVGRAAAQRAV